MEKEQVTFIVDIFPKRISKLCSENTMKTERKETRNRRLVKNIHPGEILAEEFLTPMNITAYRLSKDIDIPQTRISEIIKGNRRITADTALRLSMYFGNSPKFWLGLQDDYDIEEAAKAAKDSLKSIRKVETDAA